MGSLKNILTEIYFILRCISENILLNAFMNGVLLKPIVRVS